MKSAYWNSATGRRPSIAAPSAVPTIVSSTIGVSITRVGPNRSMNPSVTLNAPPYPPMSSPSRNTRSSRSISSQSASAIATRYVASPWSVRLARRAPGPRGRPAPPRRPASPSGLGPAAAAGLGGPVAVVGVQALGHVAGLGERRGQRVLVAGLGRRPDPLVQVGHVLVAHDASRSQELIEPHDRVLVAHVLLEQLLGDVLRGVVTGVSTPAKRDALDQRRPAPPAGACGRG